MDDVEYQIVSDVGDENAQDALAYYRKHMKGEEMFDFSSKYGCDEDKCRGWRGTGTRCDCNNYRVMWKWDDYLYAEAY